MEFKKLTEDEFDNLFTPVKNHIDDNASFSGCMFETYGEEIDYVFKLADSNLVVTIIEGEDEENEDGEVDEDGDIIMRPKTYYCSGFHYVNRIGFLILDKPYEFDFEVELDW